MMNRLLLLSLALVALTGCLAASPAFAQGESGDEPIYLLVRSDDLGMNHSKNMANERLMESGLPFSTSVMFACPWYQEAVEILRQHPHVSVGIHLTLNAEWKGYRWGPVLGPKEVPSLVDDDGYFFPTRGELFDNEPVTEEVERELRAQIERALQTGLDIDYVDYHMGAAVTTLELREVVERLADEYGLAISRYFGERNDEAIYRVDPDLKTDSLVAAVGRLEPGLNLMVFHLGLDTPEMAALVDVNEVGLPEMSRHRQGELDALLSPAFRAAVEARGIRLITYADLIEMKGLDAMRRPEVNAYGTNPPGRKKEGAGK